MGQYWTPLNIDKRERYERHQGKLSEYLLDVGPHRIFFHLLRLSVQFSTTTPKFDETK
jgi:hypothetical protein